MSNLRRINRANSPQHELYADFSSSVLDESTLDMEAYNSLGAAEFEKEEDSLTPFLKYRKAVEDDDVDAVMQYINDQLTLSFNGKSGNKLDPLFAKTFVSLVKEKDEELLLDQGNALMSKLIENSSFQEAIAIFLLLDSYNIADSLSFMTIVDIVDSDFGERRVRTEREEWVWELFEHAISHRKDLYLDMRAYKCIFRCAANSVSDPVGKCETMIAYLEVKLYLTLFLYLKVLR
jgi:hypothetical protein